MKISLNITMQENKHVHGLITLLSKHMIKPYQSVLLNNTPGSRWADSHKLFANSNAISTNYV